MGYVIDNSYPFFQIVHRTEALLHENSIIYYRIFDVWPFNALPPMNQLASLVNHVMLSDDDCLYSGPSDQNKPG